ncbi:MAG TPA: sugar transferase [Bryobacteraceae bacterium]|nr:sugar transferase [Bryobacteraceae bacterium]
MIRLFRVYFPGRTLLLALSEALVLVAVALPTGYAVLGSDASSLVFRSEFAKLLIVVAVCMACMHYHDLYNSMVLLNPLQGATRLVQVLGSACVILACIYYVYPGVQIDQTLLAIWILLAGVALIAWRKLFLTISQSARHTQRTVLLGAGPLAAQLATEIESQPQLGLRLSGYLNAEPASAAELQHLTHLGPATRLGELLEQSEIRRVIVATEGGQGRATVESLVNAKTRGIVVDDGSEFFEAVTGRVDLNSLRASMLLFFEGFRFRPLVRLYKAAASLILSLVGLILATPLMLAIAIVIRLDSPGPIIFRQKRVGKDGRPFTLYKFRSMYDSAAEAFRPAQVDDARCTRIGKWLRYTRLDELPQLFNILRGDMHFIGPRPFALEEEQELARQIPFYSNRWAVRPGATGWAQVRRGYNETLEDNIEKLAFDLYYIKHLSLGLDLLIILETIKILLLGRGAR